MAGHPVAAAARCSSEQLELALQECTAHQHLQNTHPMYPYGLLRLFGAPGGVLKPQFLARTFRILENPQAEAALVS